MTISTSFQAKYSSKNVSITLRIPLTLPLKAYSVKAFICFMSTKLWEPDMGSMHLHGELNKNVSITLKVSLTICRTNVMVIAFSKET